MKRIFLGLCMVGLSSAVQAAPTVKLSTGYFYADGQSDDLNTPDSTIQSVPFSVKVKEGPWGVRLGSSWLEIKSKGSKAESGMGDVTASVSYDLNNSWSVSLKEKFSTADKDKGLTTGYNDTKVQVDYFTTLNNRHSFFGTAGYTFKGGQDDNPDYQNGVYLSAGIGRVLAAGWTGGVSLDWTQSTNRKLDDTLGGSIFVGHKVSSQWSVSFFGGYDNSDTVSAGLGISYTLK